MVAEMMNSDHAGVLAGTVAAAPQEEWLESCFEAASSPWTLSPHLLER